MDNNTLGIIINISGPLISAVGIYIAFSNKVTRIETVLNGVVLNMSEIKTDTKDHSIRITKLEGTMENIKERMNTIENKVDSLDIKVNETNNKIDRFLPFLEQIPKILQKIS